MSKVQNRPAPALSRLLKGTDTGRRILRGLFHTTTAPRPAPASVPAVALPVADPAGLFAADELPPLSDIEAAAAKFLDASEQARAADRVKRASRKLLDRLPAARYGLFQIERVDNAREVADLDAIRAIFAANNLGDVPMKRTAPSLRVEFAPALAEVAL